MIIFEKMIQMKLYIGNEHKINLTKQQFGKNIPRLLKNDDFYQLSITFEKHLNLS